MNEIIECVYLAVISFAQHIPKINFLLLCVAVVIFFIAKYYSFVQIYCNVLTVAAG